MGTTILVVTHEHELVSQFGRRVIEIERGRVVKDTAASDEESPDMEEVALDTSKYEDLIREIDRES